MNSFTNILLIYFQECDNVVGVNNEYTSRMTSGIRMATRLKYIKKGRLNISKNEVFTHVSLNVKEILKSRNFFFVYVQKEKLHEPYDNEIVEVVSSNKIIYTT